MFNTFQRLIFSLSLTFFCVGCFARTDYNKLIGKPAPTAVLQLLDGDFVALSSYQGKQVILVFWASWCPKSKQLLTHLNNYLQEKNPAGVAVLAISIDKQKDFEKYKALVADFNAPQFIHIFSGNEYYDQAYVAFDGSEIPYVVVIDRQGKVTAAGHKLELIEEALQYSVPRH